MKKSLSTQKGQILTYEEVRAMPSAENGEMMVSVRAYDDRIVSRYEKLDMVPYTGEEILVRSTVARKLADANRKLLLNALHLCVVYGYRHPEVQKKYFEKERLKLKRIYQELLDSKLDSLTHNFSAVPSVAGHPTGGAVDITLADEKGTVLDMGTRIADFSDPEKIKTFGKGVSPTELKNRLILHDTLIEEGFAPFYGEWWHFSYGDKEWACFYEKESSIYSSIELKTKKDRS